MNPPKDQYPNALEVIRQITNLTQGEDCIYRGESAHYKYPCSSTLYRQLKKENPTKGSIPNLLKQRQSKQIKANRKYKETGDNDLEKLMWFRHLGDKVNLLDFTKNHLVALFFACFEQGKHSEDGLIVVKQKSDFRLLETEECALPDKEIVLLEPHENLQRARDQHAVFLYMRDGFLALKERETVLVRSGDKQEILNLLESAYDISEKTMFRDAYGEIDRRNREDEERVATETQPTAEMQGFTKPKDNRDVLTMEYYVRLLSVLAQGINSELLNNHADILIASFTSILKHNSRDADAYYNRALVHQSKPKPDYDQAILDYTRTIELKPDSVEAYYNRGLSFVEKRNPDYDQALSDFDRAIKLSPKLAGAYNNRGTVYAKRPDPDHIQAIKEYNRALELNPKLALVYANRAASYMNKSTPDYDRAIKDCTYALELNPNCAPAYCNRGDAYAEKPNPDHERAIADFTRAIELKHGYEYVYCNRGLSYANKLEPDYDRAISDYTRAIELNPNYAIAYYDRAIAYAKKTNPDYEKEILDYTRAIELGHRVASACNNRGTAYIQNPNPDYERAISDYTRAIELSPSYALAYHNRGGAYANMPNPDYERAISDYTHAMEFNPNDARTYYYRATAHAELGYCDKAYDDYVKALKIEPRITESTKSDKLKECIEAHSKGN